MSIVPARDPQHVDIFTWAETLPLCFTDHQPDSVVKFPHEPVTWICRCGRQWHITERTLR